jgi:hypothetical protein
MSYRGYDLQQKTLTVGWQIAITKEGKFIGNGTVTTNLAAAIQDAEKFVDRVFAIGTTASDAKL